jgi:protein ImuB
VERYLVIWCPELLEQKEEGRERRAFQQVVEAVSSLVTRIETVRPGVCAIPTLGPSRYFGGDLALSKTLAEKVTGAVPGISAGIGVADGLFAAVLAAQIAESGAGGTGAGGTGAGESEALLVPVGGSPAFLSSWPVGVLERPELADLLLRLGIRDRRCRLSQGIGRPDR